MESQTAVRLSSEPLRFLRSVASPGKNANEGAYAIGFRNRLLAIPLSVLAEPCQVLFLLCILSFDAGSLRLQIMIAWRAVTIADAKRFPALPIAGQDSSRTVTLAAQIILAEENAWATQ